MGPFFDTNVLIYFVDEDESDKNVVARALVEEHLIRGEGLLSVQVLREFYSSVRRLRRPLSDDRAREMVGYFAAFVPMPEGKRLVLDAVRRSQEASLSLWDALIVEAALAAGADRLLTEDLQHGQVFDGMRVENPFL
jgi:predicted nucleic acid-binding protein